MRKLVFFAIIILLSSCYKKKDSYDELNYNIFDELYTGEKWFSFYKHRTVNNSTEKYVDFGFTIHYDLFPSRVDGFNIEIISDIFGPQSRYVKLSYPALASDWSFIYRTPGLISNGEYCFDIHIVSVNQSGETVILQPYTECVEYKE